MRYVFCTENCTIRSKLEVGSLLLVFPPEEQALAFDVICGIAGLLETHELDELARLLRTVHDKTEEN